MVRLLRRLGESHRSVNSLSGPFFIATNSFAPGTAWCFHLNSFRSFDGFRKLLAAVCENRDKTIAFQKRPAWSTIFHKWLAHDDPARWLATAASMPVEQARKRINALPIHVYRQMTSNAGNPRCILGIESVIGTADVLVYWTAGTDPVGTEAIHQYVHENMGDQCVIHIAIKTSTGADSRPAPWICMDSATCIDCTET